MPKTSLTVAIYSGVSKNTTFIERLIAGLANSNIRIFVFGFNSGKSLRNKNVYYVLYGKKVSKLLVLIKYSVLLFLFKNVDKKKLDNIIRSKNKSNYKLQLKYYPVLWHKPDVFHAQWVKSIDDWMWVQDFGIKLVFSLRGAHINYSPIVDDNLAERYKANFPKVDGFHAVSKAIAEEAIKYNAQIEKIHIVKSGLDLKSFAFSRKEFKSDTAIKILSIGRPHWKKNYSLALDVMRNINDKNIEFDYTIIGVGDDESLLFQRSQLGLESMVHLKDSLPSESVVEAIREADVLLLPSVEEGIANVVLEAMALGTLVISTNCGGMSEVVKDGETGYLVPIRDTNAMTDALIKANSLSIVDYQKLTMQARSFIEEHHSDFLMISGMKDLYNKVITSTL